MEQWDIYDENKQKTGRTMNRNDWNMQPGDFHRRYWAYYAVQMVLT